MRRFLVGLFVLLGLFCTPLAAHAQSISSSVTLSGVVPEMRFVYVDQTGLITSVVGNTSDNIMPRVVGADNKETPMTDAIWQQYAYFMTQHGRHLSGGVSYEVNPVQIDISSASQVNEIGAQLQASGNSLQLQAGVTPESGQIG